MNDIVSTTDFGPEPFVINIDQAAEENDNFRTALWTGTYLQLTLMSIDVGGEIGLEIHPSTDQFIEIVEGQAAVRMGKVKEKMDIERRVFSGDAIFIPAGTWHNILNAGDQPLKLYSIYAPPAHHHGTVEKINSETEGYFITV